MIQFEQLLKVIVLIIVSGLAVVQLINNSPIDDRIFLVISVVLGYTVRSLKSSFNHD